MRIAPSKMFGISSGGHGTRTGIMNDILDDKNAIRVCLSWVKELRNGEQIDFFDFGTNCNVASTSNLEAIALYAKYVVASDLTRNSPSPSIGNRPSDEGNYSTYFVDPTKDARSILSNMMDSYNTTLNDGAAEAFYKSPDALKSDNTLPDWKQQLTLFECSQFAPILKKIGGIDNLKNKLKELLTSTEEQPNPKQTYSNLLYDESGIEQKDFKTAVELCFPDYTNFEQDWKRFAIKQISNRKALEWDSDDPNGMLVW